MWRPVGCNSCAKMWTNLVAYVETFERLYGEYSGISIWEQHSERATRVTPCGHFLTSASCVFLFPEDARRCQQRTDRGLYRNWPRFSTRSPAVAEHRFHIARTTYSLAIMPLKCPPRSPELTIFSFFPLSARFSVP
jgi:hypothetical protein